MAINGTFTPLTGNFTMCDNVVMYNNTISVEARFLYNLIQSQITNPKFTIYKNTIYHLFGGSKQRFDKYWRELKTLGLLVIHKLRDAKNQFYYEYELVLPKEAFKKQDPIQDESCNPEPDFPPMEQPEDGDATTWENKVYSNTEPNHIDSQTKLNNTLLQDDDNDDKETTSSQKSEPKNDLTPFIEKWTEVTHKPILLDKVQKRAIDKLITTYNYQLVLDAVQKIKESHYLMQHISVMYFIQCFEKIYSDTYKDRTVNDLPQKEKRVNPKTRFTQMDSRDWDFEELDRLEDEYIERRLAKSSQVSSISVFSDVTIEAE